MLTSMKQPSPHILLINPWITDFAAYNFWIKPLGLLYIASLLRECGYKVTLIDCLDSLTRKKRYGDGNFLKTKIESPECIKIVPRHYCQYGISEENLLEKFSSIENPDVICFTSGMTYWYPGLFKSIRMARDFFKGAPVLLGGIYATLCHEHASKYSGADFIIEGRGEREALRIISEWTQTEPPGSLPDPWDDGDQRSDVSNGSHSYSERRVIGTAKSALELDPDFFPYPAFDLYPQLDFVCMATSKGCPLRCTYCASHFLNQSFLRRDPLNVVEEIEYWTTRQKINDIAFYDDALLVNPRDHILPILREVVDRGIECNFHAPNGLHIREMDEELAGLFFKAGFKTLRLGFETSHEATQIDTGGKVGNEEFVRAVRNLKRAGYSGDEVGVYVMVGLPGQRAREAEETIAFVRGTGARPILVEYSPIPHTPLFQKAMQMSKLDIENEPLYHNNSLLPCQWGGFTMADYRRLKESIRRR